MITDETVARTHEPEPRRPTSEWTRRVSPVYDGGLATIAARQAGKRSAINEGRPTGVFGPIGRRRFFEHKINEE